MSQDRRNFLKSGIAAVAGAAACGPRDGSAPAAPERTGLDQDLLVAISPVVLPSELDEDGRGAAVRASASWIAAFEPVAELNHGYGTANIRYGPPDPAPAWQAQLEALELEAQRRFGQDFRELDFDTQNAMVRRQIRDRSETMPSPLQADHVGVALLAHWLTSPDATDRCYEVKISPLTCRGIESSPREPDPIG